MKSLFVVFLAIAVAQACKPGLLFQKSCNWCRCLPDGKTVTCTDKLCPEVANVENKDQICTPGTLFKRDCNLCKCSHDGRLSLCTEMVCPESQNTVDVKERFCEPLTVFKIDEFNSCTCNRDGTRAMCTLSSGLPNALFTESSTKNGQYCTAGTTFKLDECNTCKCSSDGTRALCTLKICPKLSITNKPNQVCKPKATFMNYCNTCICSKDGSSFACTRMSCDENMWFKNGTMKSIARPSFNEEPAQKQVCQPLSQFKNYCNTCLCSADGMRYACTEMLCDESTWLKNGTRKVPEPVSHFISNKVCEPKSTFSPDGCNTCVCNDQGSRYSCTLKACDDLEVKELLQKWGPKYMPGDACTPGKVFYRECNACVCSKNGLSAFCTMKAC